MDVLHGIARIVQCVSGADLMGGSDNRRITLEALLQTPMSVINLIRVFASDAKVLVLLFALDIGLENDEQRVGDYFLSMRVSST